MNTSKKKSSTIKGKQKVVATKNAGYSPKFGMIIKGKKYEIDAQIDADRISFFEPIKVNKTKEDN